MSMWTSACLSMAEAGRRRERRLPVLKSLLVDIGFFPFFTDFTAPGGLDSGYRSILTNGTPDHWPCQGSWHRWLSLDPLIWWMISSIPCLQHSLLTERMMGKDRGHSAFHGYHFQEPLWMDVTIWICSDRYRTYNRAAFYSDIGAFKDLLPVAFKFLPEFSTLFIILHIPLVNASRVFAIARVPAFSRKRYQSFYHSPNTPMPLAIINFTHYLSARAVNLFFRGVENLWTTAIWWRQ